MKLEKFIIQDGAAYEFTGEHAFPGETEYFLNPFGSRIEKGSVFILSHYPIYKLIAPAVKKYEREGDAYKFTGRIGIATVDEYFLDDKGSMLRGMLFRQDKDYPVYTLLAQKHTEGTKFQKGNDDGAGRPQGEGSKLYFYTTDIPIDPSKPTSFKTMKGMSELQEKLKKEFSDPPPFIKQGEDYFLYVKTAQVNKGDWYYSTNGNMLNQSVIGGLKVERPIYEKLPLTLIQDGVQYVFTGEYRQVSKGESYYYYHSKKIIKYEKSECTNYNPQKNYLIYRKISPVRISNLELLELWSHWVLSNPVPDYMHVDFKKQPTFQTFKGQTDINIHIINIMIAVIYNGPEIITDGKPYKGQIQGLTDKYQRITPFTFEELKELKVQFLSHGALYHQNDDNTWISKINYKILE